jgi:hypothetical protein
LEIVLASHDHRWYPPDLFPFAKIYFLSGTNFK